mmetsp:Transcript_24439/g.55051  ORF Transcript_24439/g.55051 Transcript_24439/m.55051 type:complete len:132 (+) Transcript_24439:1437-1832(+)
MRMKMTGKAPVPPEQVQTRGSVQYRNLTDCLVRPGCMMLPRTVVHCLFSPLWECVDCDLQLECCSPTPSPLAMRMTRQRLLNVNVLAQGGISLQQTQGAASKLLRPQLRSWICRDLAGQRHPWPPAVQQGL